MARREFPGKVRVAAWKRSSGHCEVCTRKLSEGDIYYEHIVCDALGGPPTLENCGVYCKTCWSLKTRTYDHPTIAKVKRIEIRHVGAKRSRRPMPGSRASGWRKKMDGTVERR